MDYKSFKKYIEENIRDFLPKEYEGAGLIIEPVQKINREVDAIMIVPNGKNLASRAVPTIYVNDLYKRYLLGDSLEEVLINAGNIFANSMKVATNEIGKISFDAEKIKSQVVVSLINTEANKEMLKDVVHKDFHDLSVIYKWIIHSDEQGMLSTTIKNNHLDSLGVSADELHRIAMENTRNDYPVVVRSMVSIIGDMLLEDGYSVEELEAIDRESLENAINCDDMFVITNSSRKNGAAAMLFEDKMYELSQNYGGSFYIIPSSVDELIIVSPKYFEPEQLAEMVYEVNKNEVEISERLSNEVYYYDQDKREVIKVTDVPNKSLRNMESRDDSFTKDELEVSR